MTITIRLKTDNDAFQDGRRDQEVQMILERWIAEGFHPGNLRDSNGNKVGTITITGR